MRLSRLLQPVSPVRVVGFGVSQNGVLADPEITGVYCRADQVRPGGIFVAVPGTHFDGRDFIDQALQNGAVAVMVEEMVSCGRTIVVQVANVRRALAVLSASFHGNAAERLVLIGITGTNGKTTTAGLLEAILIRQDWAVGVIGTGNYRYGGKIFDNPLTSPGAPDLHAILAEMERAGITHVIMEVSSHALDQERVYGCRMAVGIFTNLTQDHLDYHPDMAAYGACKRRMFTENLTIFPAAREKPATAIFNCQDETGRQWFQTLPKVNRISTGCEGDHQVRATGIRFGPEGTAGTLMTPSGSWPFFSPLVGAFNLENILGAVGGALALGVDPKAIEEGLRLFSGAPGRLEKVENNTGRFVFVDYAHTPDALAKVLATLRNITRGRLICVFGCGGDRDQTKRPQMGAKASDLADLVVITSDNPRSEPPEKILADITAGLAEAWRKCASPQEFSNTDTLQCYCVLADRQQAIDTAVRASKENDTILIAGKGSEPYQILGDKTIDFDDRVQARRALQALASRTQAACAMS